MAVPDSVRAEIAARLEKLAKMTVKELRAEYVVVFGQQPASQPSAESLSPDRLGDSGSGRRPVTGGGAAVCVQTRRGYGTLPPRLRI